MTDTVDLTDRELLVAVHRWARAHGWYPSAWIGWADAALAGESTHTITWSDQSITVAWRTMLGFWVSDTHPACSVVQAVDILVAARILPVELSSAYRAGMTHALDQAATELPTADRAVVNAAKVWRWSGNTPGHHERARSALMAAVDALPGRPDHGPDALPHGYMPEGCGDDCNNGQCPAGDQTHDRCTEACVAGR
ncbi:hypothetical protein ABT336_00385 [Micromonospora sp. NPDC000207]|uniref:hypothetical protein n=1 Tax=Micromonospora sp. NPDC000207 TaxID=3154246 RepID=UPI00332693B7